MLSHSNISLNTLTVANEFYRTFANVDSTITVSAPLVDYAKMLYAYHNLPEPTIIINSTLSDIAPSLSPLNSNKVLIPFSGGTDGVAAIIYAQSKGYEINLLHIHGLNQAKSSRKEKAVRAIANHFNLTDKLIIIKFDEKLKKLKNYNKISTHVSTIDSNVNVYVSSSSSSSSSSSLYNSYDYSNSRHFSDMNASNNSMNICDSNSSNNFISNNYHNDAQSALAKPSKPKKKYIKHKDEEKTTEISTLKENAAKNQYIWLLALSHMSNLQCGKILFAVQEGDDQSHFSDSSKAFTAFHHYAKTLIGEHELVIPFPTKKDYVQCILNYDLANNTNISEMASSCFTQDFFFKVKHQTAIIEHDDVQSNECGSCDKCITLRKTRAMIRTEKNLSIPASLLKKSQNNLEHFKEAKKDNTYFRTLLGFMSPENQEKYKTHTILFPLMKSTIDRRVLNNEQYETIIASKTDCTEIETLVNNIIFKMPAEDFIKNGEVSIQFHSLLTKNGLIAPEKMPKMRDFKLEFCTRAIVLRTILLIRENNIRFPTKNITPELAQADFKKLCNYVPTKQLHSKSIGRKASNLYMSNERMKVPQDGCGKGPALAWEENNFLYSTLRAVIMAYINLAVISSEEIIVYCGRNKSVSQFRPTVIFDTIHLLKKEDAHFNAESVFDPCGGWGERLVGFLAAKCQSIVYNDVNEDLKNGYQQIVNSYKQDNQTVYLSYKPAEDLTIDEMCPEKKLHDLVLSGLPFFNKEKYLGANQAHVRYPEVQTWLAGFLFKSIAQIGASLKQNHGYMVINIDDYTSNKNVKICLVEPLKTFIRSVNYLTLLNYDFKFSRGSLLAHKADLDHSPMLVIKRNDMALSSASSSYNLFASGKAEAQSSSSSSYITSAENETSGLKRNLLDDDEDQDQDNKDSERQVRPRMQ